MHRYTAFHQLEQHQICILISWPLNSPMFLLQFVAPEPTNISRFTYTSPTDILSVFDSDPLGSLKATWCSLVSSSCSWLTAVFFFFFTHAYQVILSFKLYVSLTSSRALWFPASEITTSTANTPFGLTRLTLFTFRFYRFFQN